MGLPKTKPKVSKQSLHQKVKADLGDPKIALSDIARLVSEGDLASVTDIIGGYISNSEKYSSQEQFAKAIGTTRQTLYRMIAHDDGVSMKVLFRAIEQIYEDGN